MPDLVLQSEKNCLADQIQSPQAQQRKVLQETMSVSYEPSMIRLVSESRHVRPLVVTLVTLKTACHENDDDFRRPILHFQQLR
ncbi:hypothetical protein IF2G_10218 [Cordyceps javanica]|nr:hypothetical protein IF2G_10218 [Cordyceps javanica]